MNYKISYQEMDKLGMEALSKQSTMILEEKRAQYQLLKTQSSSKSKKQKS